MGATAALRRSGLPPFAYAHSLRLLRGFTPLRFAYEKITVTFFDFNFSILAFLSPGPR